MIDDNIKNQILAKLPKVLEDLSKQRLFIEPRPRWFHMEGAEHDGVHYLFCILVGKDEKETSQMADELIEWHKKYVVDQKDVRREYDFRKRKY